MLIISEQDISQSAFEGMRTYEYILELNKNGLLPLLDTNNKLPLLARIIGALFSDGNLYLGKHNYREISFTLGQKDDVAELGKDLDALGFKYHISERTNVRQMGTRKFQMHTWKIKCCSTAFWLFLKALEVPVGDKGKQDYEIPPWIMKSSLNIKKEFLKGYLGGDGPKVTIHLVNRKNKQPYNQININDIEFYKKSLFAKSGMDYAYQLKKLFTCFGIDIIKIFSEHITINNVDIDIIHIAISSSVKSAQAYCSIGFAYCAQKRDATRPISKFLELLLQKRKMWSEKYQKSLDLYNLENKSMQEISKILNLSEGTIYGWIKSGKKPTIGYHNIKYPDWLKRGAENVNGT